MSEKVIPTTPETLKKAILEAAVLRDWDEVDLLAPEAQVMDGDALLGLFAGSTKDERDDVRDAAMTIWFHANPRTPRMTKKHFETAIKVMEGDNHECAAIWAAMTVCRYADSPKFGQRARVGLAGFKERLETMDKREEGTDWQETRDYVAGKVKDKLPQAGNFI